MAAMLPIPFADGLASGLDELSGASPVQTNVVVDGGGALRQRPGISPWSVFPSSGYQAQSIIGMVIFRSKVVYVSADRRIWSLDTDGDITALSDGDPVTMLDGTGYPTFVVGLDTLVICGGGVPQKWTGSGLTARLGGSPPSSFGVTSNAQRLILWDENLVYYSNPGEGTPWEEWDEGLRAFAADSMPDENTVVRSNVDRLYVWGEETLQTFAPDPNIDYAPVDSTSYGTSAARSVIQMDQRFAWFDNKRRFVMAVPGEAEQDISSAQLARTLLELTTVSDCWGYRELRGGTDSLVWLFPTEGRCFAYELRSGKWSERRSWNSTVGTWSPWLPQSHVRWDSQNLDLVGLEGGVIAKLDTDTFTDLGAPLKWVSRTGLLDRSSAKRKLSHRVQLTLRRGAASSDDDVVQVRYRDGLGSWSAPFELSLGAPGQYEVIREIRPVGPPYHERQWELSGSSADRVVLAKAVEEYEELD